jgi:hypothetical protein
MDIAPEITEADLRNTALVLDHLGHTKSEYVEGRSGMVCADGALRLATFARLHRLRPVVGEREGPLVMDPLYDSEEGEASVLALRYRAAVEAVVPLLPDRCTRPDHLIEAFDSRMVWTCTANRNTGELEGSARIHHFNDWECVGGTAIAELFRQAAEKVRANA